MVHGAFFLCKLEPSENDLSPPSLIELIPLVSERWTKKKWKKYHQFCAPMTLWNFSFLSPTMCTRKKPHEWRGEAWRSMGRNNLIPLRWRKVKCGKIFHFMYSLHSFWVSVSVGGAAFFCLTHRLKKQMSSLLSFIPAWSYEIYHHNFLNSHFTISSLPDNPKLKINCLSGIIIKRHDDNKNVYGYWIGTIILYCGGEMLNVDLCSWAHKC